MTLDKKPFVKYKLDEEKNEKDKTFTVRITPTEQEWFYNAKIFIKQPKNSTAIKQLAEIGAIIVLQDQKISKILEVLKDNYRRNIRLGISESEYKI